MIQNDYHHLISGPEVIKQNSCSTQLSMKFYLVINVKMPTNVGILTFMSRKNSILSLPEPESSCIFSSAVFKENVTVCRGIVIALVSLVEAGASCENFDIF